MRRPRHRVALFVVSSLAAVPLLGGCNYGQQPGAGTASVQMADTLVQQTRWGPLSADDRDLIRKVRLASLWEMPAAQQAALRAKSPKVRQISAEIAAQHMTLDVAVRAVAQKLDVELPTQPNTAQQGWLKDINSRTGHDYDVTYVKWLRFAHGQVFTLLGIVRGTTQNSVVRSFAETGITFVLNHMRLLESTGLTNESSFPSPPPVTLPPLPK
jgi:predicted outer membrane protein